MKQTLSGRNALTLWLGLIITLSLLIVVVYYAAVLRPETQVRQNREQILAECRNQVSAEMWDAAELTCNNSLLLGRTDALSAEAVQLMQKVQIGWLAYHYTKGIALLAADEPGLALAELDTVFGREPTYEEVGEMRRRAQDLLSERGTAPPMATATLDRPATDDARNRAVAQAVQATADVQAEETRMAEMVNATLTAQAPTRTPIPTYTPIPAPAQFGPLTFCSAAQFNATTKKCVGSQQLFTGMVKIVYVSWTPPPQYNNASFKRMWYLAGTHFLTTETFNKYAYLEVDQRDSLKPGQYRVELYVQDRLMQTGTFEVR